MANACKYLKICLLCRDYGADTGSIELKNGQGNIQVFKKYNLKECGKTGLIRDYKDGCKMYRKDTDFISRVKVSGYGKLLEKFKEREND